MKVTSIRAVPFDKASDDGTGSVYGLRLQAESDDGRTLELPVLWSVLEFKHRTPESACVLVQSLFQDSMNAITLFMQEQP